MRSDEVNWDQTRSIEFKWDQTIHSTTLFEVAAKSRRFEIRNFHVPKQFVQPVRGNAWDLSLACWLLGRSKVLMSSMRRSRIFAMSFRCHVSTRASSGQSRSLEANLRTFRSPPYLVQVKLRNHEKLHGAPAQNGLCNPDRCNFLNLTQVLTLFRMIFYRIDLLCWFARKKSRKYETSEPRKERMKLLRRRLWENNSERRRPANWLA